MKHLIHYLEQWWLLDDLGLVATNQLLNKLQLLLIAAID